VDSLGSNSVTTLVKVLTGADRGLGSG